MGTLKVLFDAFRWPLDMAAQTSCNYAPSSKACEVLANTSSKLGGPFHSFFRPLPLPSEALKRNLPSADIILLQRKWGHPSLFSKLQKAASQPQEKPNCCDLLNHAGKSDPMKPYMKNTAQPSPSAENKISNSVILDLLFAVLFNRI